MKTQEVLPICIAGEWRLGTGDRYGTRYPATGEVVAELNAASLADVEEAVQGAHQAFLTSGWAQRKPHERAAVLYRVAELIRAKGEQLAQRQRLDNGKPISETRAWWPAPPAPSSSLQRLARRSKRPSRRSAATA